MESRRSSGGSCRRPAGCFQRAYTYITGLILFDIEGIALAFLAVAPACGHASLFLHSGKVVAVTYGVWLALTGLAGPLARPNSAIFVLISQSMPGR